MAEPFYITTAIAYPNGKPHIGHAYEAIAADVIARFQRQQGRDVRFQTGTDEHGLKMAQKARELGVTPAALAEEMSQHFIDMCAALNISYDIFLRTTSPAHHASAQELWRRMEANGDLYLDRYEGWYSIRDEAYYDESELVAGEGGAKLSPQGTPVEWTVEESWFFRLSAYGDKLLALYRDHPEFLEPESRRNEVVRFVEGGLRDLSISRTSFDWGVKVPGSENHVMYVWVDALNNYLTGLGFPEDTPEMAKWWPCDIHLIGKDIVRFHAIYWPAFLMSAHIPVPRKVYGHGFLLHRGEKMSKSLGNVVDPIELAERFGVDSLRYFLMREVSFGQDGTWSAEAIVTRCNAELANSFGNLAQRVLSFIAKNLDGELPPFDRNKIQEEDEDFLVQIELACGDYVKEMDKLHLDRGIQEWMHGVYMANAYVDAQAPWALRKTDPARMSVVLGALVAAIRDLALAIHPVVPNGASKVLDMLGDVSDRRYTLNVDGGWDLGGNTWRMPDHRIVAPTPVFPRLDLPAEAEA